MTRIARLFFVFCICGIVYLSLYPGNFQSHPRSMELLSVPISGRRLILDALLNVLFYVPLGAAALASLRRGWRAWLVASGFGSLLSFLIETAQLYTPTRNATVADWQANTAGAMLGATLGYVLTSPRGLTWVHQLRRSREWSLTLTGALFLILWVLWQAFPFLPVFSLPLALAQLRGLLHPAWSWVDFTEFAVGFLVLARVLGRSRWLWLAYAFLLTHIFFEGRMLAAPPLLGAAFGWIAARWLVPGRAAGLAGVVLALWLAFEEFRPFLWVAQTQPLSWSPFESWYVTGFVTYYAIIFRKLFLYTSVIWGLRSSMLGWKWAVGVPALILAVGEWTQRHLAGRTPETTDLLVLAIGAGLLAACERRD